MSANNQSQLYFFGIVPDEHLCAQVHEYKIWLQERYNIKKALNSPAHITIQAPMRLVSGEFIDLKDKLIRFCNSRHKFNIKLKGIGSFSRQTIYIDVEETTSLTELYEDWLETSSTVHGKKKFTPHMTIANRDIPNSSFDEIKSHFEALNIDCEFKANAIKLFRHNGQLWQLECQFQFPS